MSYRNKNELFYKNSNKKGLSIINYGKNVVKSITSGIVNKIRNVLIGLPDGYQENDNNVPELKYAFDNRDFVNNINYLHGINDGSKSKVENLRKSGTTMLYNFNKSKDELKIEKNPHKMHQIIDDFANIDNYIQNCENLSDDIKEIIDQNIKVHVNKLNLYASRSKTINNFIDPQKLRQNQTLIEKILDRF